MDTSSYLERFLRYGVSLEEAQQIIKRILAFKKWLEKRGNSLDGASKREIRAYMDEFEYIDACICNRGVEKRRDVFHAWRKAQDCGAESLLNEE